MTGIRRPDGGASGDDTHGVVGELDHWLAELRSDAAGHERTRRRTLMQASAEEATVHAAITDLAERAETVVLELDGDRLARGVVRLVGVDVVVLRDGRVETVARLDAVASIRLRPDQPNGPGRLGARGRRTSPPLAPRPRPAPDAVDFVRVLAALAETEPMVTVHRRGVSAALNGVLTRVGHDVAVVDAPPAGLVYVPLWSVVDVSLTGSG